MNPREEFLSRKEGKLWRCGFHDWHDTRPCPRCAFKGGFGAAKITKCLYDCVREGKDVHGGALGHIGEVVWIGYLADRGYFKEGLDPLAIGCEVRCPLSNVFDKTIIALEVADVTYEEYAKVF